jgi:hypothetical protein
LNYRRLLIGLQIIQENVLILKDGRGPAMKLEISEKNIDGRENYIYIGFGDRAEVRYDICDIEISWEWYGGDWEHGCVYGRGYSFKSLDGFSLENETFCIDGEDCGSKDEFLKVAGITAGEFEGLGQEIKNLVASVIEAEASIHPDNFITE